MAEKKNKPTETPTSQAAALRRKAEEALGKQQPDRGSASPEDMQRLLHELQVHQIELEMQNEELLRVQNDLEASRSRYFDLYDTAPVGYFTLSQEGLILEANTLAATLLGVDRTSLRRQPLSRYIMAEDADTYYLHRKKLFASGEAQTCEIRMLRHDSAFFWTHIEETLVREAGQPPVSRAIMLDISRRKQDEETLRLKDENYRILFQGMSQGAFYQAADGRLTDVNPAALRIFGLTRQQFLERTSHSPEFKVIREDGTAMLPDEHPSMAALKTRLPIKDTTLGVFNHLTNSYVWVIVNAIPQCRPGENSPFQVYVTLHDITERRQAEQALKAFAVQQEALLLAIPDIIMEVDANKVYTWANQPGTEFFGDDVVGRQADFYFEGEQSTYIQVEKIFQGSEDILHIESWQRRRDGQKRLLSWQCHVLKDSQGNVIGALSSAHDITGRRQAEEALKQSEYRQKAILNNIPDIAWIKDIEGKYIAVNEAYEKAAVCLQEKIIGKNDEDLWPAWCAAQYRKNDIQVIQSGKRITVEENMMDHDGVAKVMEAIRTPLYDNKGDLIGTAGIARDVTERVKMTEALLLASQKWRDTFDAIIDPVSLLSLDGTIEQCNRAFVDYLGLDFPAVLGRKCHELIHTTNDRISGCPTVKALESGQRETVELQVGEKFFIVMVDPVKELDGKICAFVHTMRDITRLKHYENVLLEQTAHLCAAERIAHVGSWQRNLITGELIWSDETRRIFGWPLDRPVTFDDFMLCVHPEDVPLLQKKQSKVLAGDAPLDVEYRILRPDGEIRHVHERCELVHDATGMLIRLEGFAQDITERKQAEQALQESEERFKAIANYTVDWESWFGLDGKYLWINPGVEQITGYTAEEIMSMPDFSKVLIAQEDRELFSERFGDFLRFTSGKNFEFRYLQKNGAKCWLSVSWQPIFDSKGNPLGTRASGRDITERKEAEEALLAKNKELEQFTYSVSHDLRSPLVTIRTFMGHLAEDMAQGDTEHVEQDIDFINNASQKMVEMLDELLQLSRIGRTANPSVEAPLQEIVQEALNLVAGRIDELGVRVTVTQKPVLLFGDRVRLVEVFQNLVDNAAKFMGEQKVPLIEIGAEKKNGDILCFVRDNGMGIEPRFKDKLFGLFEKLNSGMEGSGIGLALVKRIIETHGGTIWAESEGVGKGTCFYFCLPGKQVQG